MAEVGFAAIENGGESLCSRSAGRLERGFGLALELDGRGVGDVEARAIEAHVGAQQPGEERMLVGGIAADEQNGAGGGDVAQAGGFAWVPGEGAGEGCVVGGALVVDIVGVENGAREFLQQVIFFVGGAVGADDADGCAAARVANLLELAAARRSACSQVAGSSLPAELRTSGCVRRSGLSTKSKPKRPLAQRKSLLMPLLSRLSARTISEPSLVWRTPRVTLQPSAQCVQTVET